LVALTAQGANIPPQILLELSPLQASVKRKLLAILNKPDPVQEQGKQITLQGEAAKVDETKSKTQLNLAKAQETAQGDPGALQEKQMDMQMKREEHGLKQQELAAKVQSQRELSQIKISGEFAKLQSNQVKSQQDLQMNQVKNDMGLRQAEEKHQMSLRQAAQKPAAQTNGNGA